jgi:hypothetical protein
MFRTITCVHCGTRQRTHFRIAPGKKIRCRSCGLLLPDAVTEDLLRMQDLMRMGDDDGGGGGGGDWGGGSSEAEAEGGDEDEDDEEEDDGKGGKKKKKKAKAKSGGFFANLLGGFVARIVSAVIGIGLLGACCCCAIGIAVFFPGHPLAGEWEGSHTKTIKVEVENDKGEKIKKDEVIDVLVKLKIEKTDDKNGTGVYTIIEDENTTTYNFKWKDWDKEKKTVVFEMDKPDNKFWKDIKSPATFTVDTTSGLILTSGTEVITLNHPIKDAPPKVGGGKKKKK